MTRIPQFRQGLVVLLVALFMQGCVAAVPADPSLASIDNSNLPPADLTINIPGLSTCTTATDPTLHLNTNEPVTILVHGCSGSAARFRSLAQVFAFHGQQTACFTYNDRDSLMVSSAELIAAVNSLAAQMQAPQITVIGHSQGGLISRKALIKGRNDKSIDEDIPLHLVTISAPYAGIAAADHCASVPARLMSLGLVVPVCRLISGGKWHEITHASPFIKQPGELLDQVSQHLKVVTDEQGSCRQYDDKGVCTEDDFVFSTREQYFEGVDVAAKVENIEVAAGHAEIVGDYRVPPEKLIKLLQAEQILRSTPQARQDSLAVLLSRLYDRP